MMNKQPLVSIITYCYNGERFVHRYFEALLNQTYENIELIFFDNGSIDNTLNIAEQYKNKLEKRGIRVNLIHYSDNQNTCRLKQEGMQLMNGEYFFGCDSDDIICPTYVEEMSNYLTNHPHKGIVFCQINIVEETTGEKRGIMKISPNIEEKGAFLDMLLARNCIFTAISYMINKNIFIEVNHGLQILQSNYGENPQMQLPLLYHDLQGYIEKPLGNYTVRSDSYTGNFKKNYRMQVESHQDTEKKLLDIIINIPVDNIDYYSDIIKKKWRREAFYASVRTKDKKLIKLCYNKYRETKDLSIKDHLVFAFWPIYLVVSK